jgi:DnaJ-class molecular chaperone
MSACKECDGRGFVRSGHADLPKSITCCYCNGTGKAPKRKPRPAPSAPDRGEP